MLIGEIVTLIYYFIVRKKEEVSLKKTKNFKNVLKKFSGYSIASILANMTTLIDKFLVYPLLGQLNLIIYTIGTTFSKLLLLISNPINDVVLTWLAKIKTNNSKKLILKAFYYSFGMIIILSIVSIPIIYLATYILYNQYINEIKKIIILLSISGSISFISSFFKSFVIRYSKSVNLIYIYILHIVIFAVCGFIGANYFGLNGFIISTIISKIQLLLSYAIVLSSVIKKTDIPLEESLK